MITMAEMSLAAVAVVLFFMLGGGAAFLHRRRHLAAVNHKEALKNGFDLDVVFEDTGFDVEVEFDDGIDDHGMQRTSTIQAKAYLGEKTPEMRARARAYYTDDGALSHGWVRRENETRPGEFFYWNTLTHETRLEPPHEGPRNLKRPSRLSQGVCGVQKHISHQIARASRESARRKKKEKERAPTTKDGEARHGTYNHWGPRELREDEKEGLELGEVVMSDIHGHHQNKSADECSPDTSGEGDYFDDIDDMLNYHDSLKSSKTDNEDEEFAFTNPMLEKAVAGIDSREDLPDGWTRVFHEESGKHYYHNEETDETCWVHPRKHDDPEAHFVNPKTGTRFDIDHL
jgi:hypothetical protein